MERAGVCFGWAQLQREMVLVEFRVARHLHIPALTILHHRNDGHRCLPKCASDVVAEQACCRQDQTQYSDKTAFLAIQARCISSNTLLPQLIALAMLLMTLCDWCQPTVLARYCLLVLAMAEYAHALLAKQYEYASIQFSSSTS